MSHLYLLAGEKLELAESELNGFLKSQGIKNNCQRTGKLAETDSEPKQLKRLALTHEVSRKITEIEKSEDIGYNPDSSYAVRVEKAAEEIEVDKKKLEKEIGDKLSNEENSVDLENPETVVKAYILDEDRVVLGELVEEINRGLFRKRRNQNRPFSSPVSLDPVLARVLVNLSEAGPGDHILDPFCGTGGILIEAGLCVIGVHGLDVKEEMKEGTEENLENYGIISHNIRQENISEVDEPFREKIDTVVTDPPYGKSSRKTEDAIDDFLDLVKDFKGRTVFLWKEESLEGYESEFSIYIHQNLQRHVFIVD